MAPKQEKAKVAARQKAVEDKTFGLKNKNKSKQVQQYVNQLKQSASQAGNANKAARVAAAAGQVNLKDKKKAEEERQKELNALFAVAIKQPKVPLGVDPKSVVCEFFRHGQCTKGFKCKFSHDLTVERKGPKIDLYTDQRDAAAAGSGNPEDEEQEGMADWDQETLERVVKEKHGNEKPSNATSIICKYFIDAVEKHQYGWFWKCPNGADCKYRHALPPGYVLKSQMKELLEEESRNQRDVAEQIEEERAKIEARTPITEEVFRAWRMRKVEARRAKKAQEEEERRKKGIMTGREIFLQEGFTVEDDAGASGADDLVREGQAEEEEAIRLMLEKAKEAAAVARQRAIDEPSSIPPPTTIDEEEDEEEGQGDEDEDEEEEEDGGAAGPSSRAGRDGGQAGPSTHLQLDDEDAEELFEGDDDDEEDDLDEEELDELAERLQQQGAAVCASDGAGPSGSR